MSKRVDIEVLDTLECPKLTSGIWQDLLQLNSQRSVFSTQEWHRAWWNSLGEGRAVVVLAFSDSKPITMAPLFFTNGVGFFIGTSEDSYYLDFIGDNSDPEIIAALLNAARKSISPFRGFEFHWLREDSVTTSLLPQIAQTLELDLVKLWELPAPTLDINRVGIDKAVELTKKKALRHSENSLRRNGDLSVQIYQKPAEILGLLPHFFQQHINRWSPANIESRFLYSAKRRFYEEIVRDLGALDQVRLTVVKLNNEFAAFDFGLIYSGCYTMYQGSYEVDYGKYSPGNTSLKYTLLDAISAGCSEFDLGPGEHAYKLRFASDVGKVAAWGLYQ